MSKSAPGFHIMICSDTHLGHKEKDPIQYNDSFTAFDEVLSLANENNVDFLIHGGDLFHEHKPSKETLTKTGQLLTKHVFGDKTHSFKVSAPKSVNLKDASLNIKLPIFIIHGNHDDPGGMENLSNIDILHSTKLVNYFGRSDTVEKLEIEPILFMKNGTKIALYGIGYIKDDRFNLAFEKKQVKFRRPEGKDWFNILVIHQTKERGTTVGYNKRAFVKEKTLPSFIDLVLWGHEHECIPVVKKCELTGSHILYMGSTTITSLIDAEARPKHCFLLRVDKNEFEVTSMPVKKARPFLYDQIELSKCGIKKGDEKGIEKCIERKISDMLKGRIDGTMVPLLRLKVEYSGHSVVNTRGIGKRLEGKVANCNKDFVKFYKKPATMKKPLTSSSHETEALVRNIEDPNKAELDLIIEKNLSNKCRDGLMGGKEYLEAIDDALKTESKAVETVWKGIYLELRKHAYKILYERSEDMEKFKGGSLEETYENIVQHLMNFKIEYNPPEELKTNLPHDLVKSYVTSAEKLSISTTSQLSSYALSAKEKQQPTKRKPTEPTRKTTRKRTKEDNGWTLEDAISKAKSRARKSTKA